MMYLLTFYIFILGLAIGSFLNVVIDRISNNESIQGRSHCDYCKKTLAWFDLIPLVSFLSTGGKCRYCKKKLSFQYPFVELLTGVLFTLFYYHNNGLIDARLLQYFIVIACSVTIFMTDLKWQIILDEPLAILFLTGIIFLPLSTTNYLMGTVIGTVFFLLIHVLSRGRAMGFADVKLVFVMGLLLPFTSLLVALYVAFLTGGIISAILLIGRLKKLSSRVAFGPFLVIGLLFALWVA